MHLKDTLQLINVLLRRRAIVKRSKLAVIQQCGDGLRTRSRPFERSRLRGNKPFWPATLIR
jgi:hypothetical protein